MTLKWLGAPTISLNFNMKKAMNKTIKQVDKDTNYMYQQYGTVCLVTDSGKADRLLKLASKRRINKESGPIDAWDI